MEWHQPYENSKTRDTFKTGDPQNECTGIALCCYASDDVIREAIGHKCNLIICHESLYYGDEYDPAEFAGLTAFEHKKKMLEDNHITVWRDHDHMHGKGKPWVPERVRNDYIYYGFMKVMGWDEYVIGDRMKPVRYALPSVPAEQLADELMDKLQLNGLRMIGSMDTVVNTVYMAEHCTGRGDDQKILQAVRADAIIPLEMVDWTVAAYVRDACPAGQHKIIYQPGHFNVEEAGMKYMKEWIGEAIRCDVPIYYFRSKDPFIYRGKTAD